MYNPDEECKAMIAALKKLCEQRGVSPHAVAIKAEISISTMSYIMKGETNPQVYTLLQLCNTLSVQIGRNGLVNLEKKYRLAFMPDTDDFRLDSLI